MCLIHFAKVNEEMQDEINMRLFRAAARGNSWHRHQSLRLQQSDRPRHQKAHTPTSPTSCPGSAQESDASHQTAALRPHARHSLLRRAQLSIRQHAYATLASSFPVSVASAMMWDKQGSRLGVSACPVCWPATRAGARRWRTSAKVPEGPRLREVPEGVS
jgi:hypothetical protein